MGSLITDDISEKDAYAHRATKAWGVFHKWSHVLCCDAPLAVRLKFWRRVVEPSMLWGLQTCRTPTKKTLIAFAHIQHNMIRKMMKSKRQNHESWLDWHRRTLGLARDIARQHRMHVEQLLEVRRESWAGHLIRLGCKSGVVHAVKLVLAWRPLTWWRSQQIYNAVTLDAPVLHPHDWGQPRRWEESLPIGWMANFGHSCAD